MKRALLLFLLTSTMLFSQSRFNGTWEMKMDTLTFSFSPLHYLLDAGMFHCLSCNPRVDVKADGSDQKVTGYPYDTLAVRVVDATSVDFIQKKDGKPIFTCTEIVAADGETKTEEFSETPTTQKLTGRAVFGRVAPGPAGSHALSGTWQMRSVRNTSSVGPLMTYRATDGSVSVSDGSTNYVAQLDGKDYPIEGSSSRDTASLRLLDQNTLETDIKRNGKVVSVSVAMVDEDRNSMRVVFINIEPSGKTMTYIAQKRP